MKHIQHIIISAALISLASAACASTYTNAWDVDLVRNPPVLCDVWRGESIALTARTGLSSLPAEAEFYWQSPDMGDAWWSTNAVASATGDITVDWGPAMDSNASAYLFFFRAGNIYRPRGTIKMHGSPGAIPNELAPPVRTIDYDLITVLNPPWATPDDITAAINAILETDPVALPVAEGARDAIAGHVADTNNPHGVTAASLGALTAEADPVALPVAQDALSKANAAQAEAEAKVPMDEYGAAMATEYVASMGSIMGKSILEYNSLTLGFGAHSMYLRPVIVSVSGVHRMGEFDIAWPIGFDTRFATVADIADAVSGIDVEEHDPLALPLINAHLADADNPHNVTAAQVGAATPADLNAALDLKADAADVSAGTNWLYRAGLTGTVAFANAGNRPQAWEGTGELVVTAFEGLQAPIQCYWTLKGFNTVTLPAGVYFVGGGTWQAGMVNHFTVWKVGDQVMMSFLTATEVE